ncbi:1-phosphofructokinase [Bacillus luteolus]|uniref:Tagatose-6-phosphate kinase n=1 Tax=Litchfieldia luteola TaxID=682179 RepID=A0ABR9QNT3_9BACI|nr:1-phosphofructokinase [Cytobacillus luteolus]MBE4910166.1 1-phosphofructokinase [Cytobacillus luteolus]MBP1942268.1 1-phosphofructokinase [Cytobacillus luteolus]
MIYTCTLNPSIDFIVHINDFKMGDLNKISKEMKYPGGKGINVARVLKRLGIKSKALGFVGGFTGEFIEDYLHSEEIDFDFIKVNGDSRINIKLKTDVETEINGLGPSISSEQLSEMLEKIKSLSSEDVLVLAGSIPVSLPEDIYVKMAEICRQNDVKVIVDASGKTLLKTLEFKPFLLKPNHHELGELFDVEITTPEEAVPYGKKLVELGAENVIVSLAGKGALLINKDMVLHANVPSGIVENSVGAGDSVVAGFIGTYMNDRDLKEAFKMGVASGSATAFSPDLCTREQVYTLRKQIEVVER